MTYGIQLSFNNKQELIDLPVLPGAIEIGDGGKGKSYDIMKLGEINVIKDPKLSEYAFSSTFPVLRYPFVVTDRLLGPAEYVEFILKWMKTKRPIRFNFVGDSFEINTPASIEGFQWKEVAGSGGEIEYSLKLKKYVFYSAQRVQVVQTQSVVAGPVLTKEAPARPNDRQPAQTYTLAAGDTLWKVAQSQLGDGARWKEIQKLNNITDAEIKTLQIGKVLKLPA
jgi:nucleoid-associated protein YgaU